MAESVSSNKLDRNIELLSVELSEKPADMNVKAYLAESLSGKTDAESIAEAESLLWKIKIGRGY